MKAEARPDDGVSYWAYILIDVDDILCVHHDPGSPLAKLDEYFKMKEGSIQVPAFYLGAKLKKTVLPNGVVAWGMSSSKYVQFAVQNVKEYLAALPGDQMMVNKSSGLFAGDTSLSLMRVLSWILPGQTSTNLRLVFCAGVWNWDALTSSLRYQCCPLICACREKATWKLYSMCVHTCTIPGR
jgi:hypothetical protein